MTLNSVEVARKGFDIIWDKMMFDFKHKFLNQGFDILEKQIEEITLKIRLIVETTHENIDVISAINYYDIRHLDNMHGNFEIMDKRTYMIYIFHKDIQKPEQAFFCNSKALVDKQQTLLETLWEIAVPLNGRNKTMELQDSPEFHK